MFHKEFYEKKKKRIQDFIYEFLSQILISIAIKRIKKEKDSKTARIDFEKLEKNVSKAF